MLWPFAYVIVMLAFAGHARSNRQSHGSAIGAGMLVATMLRGLAFSAVSATKSDPGMVWLVYALPLSGIAGGTWMLVRSRPVSLPKKWQDRIDLATQSTQAKVTEASERYLAWRRRLAGVRA
jgi:hypothetical protein